MKTTSINDAIDDEADIAYTALEADSDEYIDYDDDEDDDEEADDGSRPLEADSDLSRISKKRTNAHINDVSASSTATSTIPKIVSTNDEYNYNYSLLYNFEKLKKGEIASSSQYEVNYVGPVLCEDISAEKMLFQKCVDITSSKIMKEFNHHRAFDIKNHNYDHGSFIFITNLYIKNYLNMLRSNFLFDIGFKIRNQHKFIDEHKNILRLCRCPCSMDIWMKKVIHTSMIVNQSDECNCDVTWYTPIELVKHLESTFYDDDSDANNRAWLHKITACYLKEYYREFYPSP